jgi:hypothetical protein
VKDDIGIGVKKAKQIVNKINVLTAKRIVSRKMPAPESDIDIRDRARELARATSCENTANKSTR